jgi:uncharacterized protein
MTSHSPDSPVASEDTAAVARQLGRPPRGVLNVAHRCPCGEPDVVTTAPRLADGTPFPTVYYLTCPRAASRIGTLEAEGWMAQMQQRLAEDPGLAQRYASAHDDYLTRRAAWGEVPEIVGVSAGGMPDRVKCLHVLAAHSLAAGPGVNPLGDEVVAAIDGWWQRRPCATRDVEL